MKIAARIAKALRKTPARVSQLRRLGMPVTSVREACEWYRKHVRGRDGATTSANQRLVRAKAGLVEARLRLLRATLCEREDAEAMQRQVLGIVRDVCGTLAQRVAGPLATMKDPAQIQAYFGREIDGVLTAAAVAIEEWARAQLARDEEAKK